MNVQTLRYYECRGLLEPPQRTLGGHGLYPEETVTLLQVIKTAQGLGYTLEEVTDHSTPPPTVTTATPNPVYVLEPKSRWPRST